MRVVKPIPITDVNLTSSTIPEPDASVGEVEWVAGTYVTGVQRINTTAHRIYEVTADPDTTDDPLVGILADPPTWVDVGPTNRFAMFDNVNSSQSEETTQLIVEITPDLVANAVAGFQIENVNDINITVTDPTEGVVYNTNVAMDDNSAVTDWYYYFYSPIIKKSAFVLLDLPAYPAATVKMTADGGAVKFGTFIIGNQLPLGIANLGTNVQLLDFSKKETDDFGNVIVKQGRTSKLVEYDVTVLTAKVTYVFNVLSSLTTTPAVWVGSDDPDDATLVFGYYRDYQNNISSYEITDATITIEGLV